MNRTALGRLISGIVLVVTVWIGVRGAGPAPPLGRFLDPWGGVWAVAGEANRLPVGAIPIPGLTGPVRVRIDDRGVPHIFATSEEDVSRALGWIVARDRLFQLELQMRATAGTLTELVGAVALGADRRSRSIGLAWGAERKWAALDTTSQTYRDVLAYAQGVNAWIDHLGPRDLPLEYRLLNARPVHWEPRYSLYLMAQMGLTLAWTGTEGARLRAQGLVGREAAEALIPVHSGIQEPIQPRRGGGGYPRFDLPAVPPPGAPDPAAALAGRARDQVDRLVGWGGPGGGGGEPGDALGSNNWAVAPGRTAGGATLLAGDPHLGLSLPSIWYEAHLVVRGTLDVAGVTFVGSPGIVIGFNRDLAWTFTNTGGDVLDLYREEVDDTLSPTRYRVDGAWLPLTPRVETFRGKGGEVLAVDTVRHTHRGPLLAGELGSENGAWVSLRWTVHDVSDELTAFGEIVQATSVDSWLRSMERFVAPTQNGLVADRAGHIAIRSSGRYPIRPVGRGDTVLDGRLSTSDWDGDLPMSRWPGARDPSQGYLASANQEPVDPRDDSAYYGADWPSPWRAMRINALLRRDSMVTPDAMRRYQTDPGSERVNAFLPPLLARARATPGDTTLARVASILGSWDGRYTVENTEAVLFESIMSALRRGLWDELILPAEGGRPARFAAVPDETVLLALLGDSTNLWWDDHATPDRREGRDDVVDRALHEGYDSTVRRFGPPGPGWRWGNVQHANIYHLLRIPSLSALNLEVQSGPSTLAPSSGGGTFGPSWRMVVELGSAVRAWGTYPGGQSGNPVSRWYADRIGKWQTGTLDTLLFPSDTAALPASRVAAAFTLIPGTG